MSLFSSIGKFIGKVAGVAKKIIPKELAPVLPFVPGAGPLLTGVRTIGTLAGLGGATRSALPQIQIPPAGNGRFPVVTGSVLGQIPRIGGAIAGGVRALPGLGRAAAGTATGLARRFPRSAKALRDLGLVASGGLIFDQAGNIVGRRPPARRMNPMNVRAARRAARRIKGAMKVCRELESCMPRRRAPPRCPPSRGRR